MLCKYLTLKSGVGPRPATVSSISKAFPDFPDQLRAHGSGRLYRNGEDIVVVLRGAEGNNPVPADNVYNVLYDTTLVCIFFGYYNVTTERRYAGVDHQDGDEAANMTHLSMTVNGNAGQIQKSGILRFTNAITLSGKGSNTVLRFHGTLTYSNASATWRGFHQLSDFDPMPYLLGYSTA